MLLNVIVIAAVTRLSLGSNLECTTDESHANRPNKLFNFLTDPCRYNKAVRAPTPPGIPLNISVRCYIYHLKTESSEKLNIEVKLLLEFHWNDTRLQFNHMNHSSPLLLGKNAFDRLWLPHTIVTNEIQSTVQGHRRDNDILALLPNGLVVFTTYQITQLKCQPMNLKWFPFDHQECQLIMTNWRYKDESVRLAWATSQPVRHGEHMSPTEFNVSKIEPESNFEVNMDQDVCSKVRCDIKLSSLILNFKLDRRYGHYLITYYLPSVLLVMLSWVSFWLAPDAIPGRVLLGSGTMLTFMLLNWADSNVPKASDFKANDMWELCCTGFLFLSLAEFAFVNTIDRRGSQKVRLKKISGKYILRYSVSPTPKLSQAHSRRRSSSCPSSPELRRLRLNKSKPGHKSVERLKSHEDFADEVTRRMEKLLENQDEASMPFLQIKIQNDEDEKPPAPSFFTMTPQEIASWIDNKSRVFFPLSFLVFNLVYWSFLWVPDT